jgi:hypothetical protein
MGAMGYPLVGQAEKYLARKDSIKMGNLEFWLVVEVGVIAVVQLAQFLRSL